MANESGINFISVKGPELLNMVSHLVTCNHTGFAVEQEFSKMADHFVTYWIKKMTTFQINSFCNHPGFFFFYLLQ